MAQQTKYSRISIVPFKKLEATNMGEWKDLSGKTYELKQDGGEWWYRVKGEDEDKWKKGHPPGWIEKSKIPLDQR